MLCITCWDYGHSVIPVKTVLNLGLYEVTVHFMNK